MAFVYVNEEFSKISTEASKLIIEGKDVRRTIPIESITGVVLFGNISVTSPCITGLMERGIPLIWLSKRGRFFGRLESTQHIDIIKQRKQFRLGEDDEFCLEFSKRILKAKVNNQKVFLRRIARDRLDIYDMESILEEVIKLEKHIAYAGSLPMLMGYEGAISKLYFKGISGIISPIYRFSGRSKQPPRDKFNSLLSFGYTLLMYEIHSAIEANGLNPYAAFLHKDKRNHPALASDMMEEWRAPLIDSLVFDLAMRDFFKEDEFSKERDDGGVYLAGTGIKKIVTEYEKKLSTKNKYLAYIESPLSFREGIHHQMEGLSRAIVERNPELYYPVMIR